MKKIFKVFACVVFTFVICLTLVGCGDTEVEYTLGLGVEVNLTSSKETAAQVDATVAAVLVDKDGKIVSCRLDAVQNKATLTDGAYEVTNLKTKMELGDDYNMAKYGQSMDWNNDGIVKEWYDQAKAFENYVVGKTGEEVKSIQLQTNSLGYQVAVDETLLNAGCTIQITDFIAAVYKACTDTQNQKFTASSNASLTLGVAATSFVDAASKNATADAAGELDMYSDFAATVVENGKIVACLNDAIQPKIAFDTTGVTGTTFVETKRNLKEDYNMAKWGQDANGDNIVKEWYEQSAAFSKHVIGMTGEEVKNMETKANSINYQMSTDEALLAAGCTIQITDIKAVVAKAVANAR